MLIELVLLLYFCFNSKAKTQRGKRVIEDKSPKVVENTKRALFIRGGRTSELVTQALKDLVSCIVIRE